MRSAFVCLPQSPLLGPGPAVHEPLGTRGIWLLLCTARLLLGPGLGGGSELGFSQVSWFTYWPPIGICIYIYICMYVFVCVYIYMCISIDIYLYICNMDIYIYIYLHSIYLSIYLSIYPSIYLSRNTLHYITFHYISLHVYIHVYMWFQILAL